MFNTQAEVAASAEAQFKQQQQNMQAFVDTVATMPRREAKPRCSRP